MDRIKGTPASKGIAIGRVHLYHTGSPDTSPRVVSDTEEEVARFMQAMHASLKNMDELHDYALGAVGQNEAMVFEIHAMMLQDRDFKESICTYIRENSCNAEHAVYQTSLVFADMFSSMDDAYMRERASDVKDVANHVLRVLTGSDQAPLHGLDPDEPVIIAARDLMPSETIRMAPGHVQGFITRRGSSISHSAILARTMGIPAVAELGEGFSLLREGDLVVVNGFSGEVLREPDEAALERCRNERDLYVEKQRVFKRLVGRKAVSLDGVSIEIAANIGHPADVRLCVENDAESVGLMRSEFLYLEAVDFPSEQAQYEAYRAVLEGMAGRVVVRTFDLGADKRAAYFDGPQEANPALGLRAIRICLREPELFLTQLRALLRASVHGQLGIMFPMITGLEELHKIKEWVAVAQQQLKEAGQCYSDAIKYGVMIETPAAVMISDLLAREVDFFSVGTNDLTQYALACDRMSETIGSMFDPRSLSVLRMVALTVRNAHRAGIRCGICGESAADPELTALYLRLGVDELSVSPNSVLEVRNKVLHTDSRTADTAALNIYTVE